MSKKSNYNPYCKLCGSCGEDGCCSHIGCFSTLVQNPKCEYGEIYVRDAIFNNEVNNMTFELFSKLEKDTEYTKDMFISEFNIKFDELLKKIY